MREEMERINRRLDSQNEEMTRQGKENRRSFEFLQTESESIRNEIKRQEERNAERFDETNSKIDKQTADNKAAFEEIEKTLANQNEELAKQKDENNNSFKKLNIMIVISIIVGLIACGMMAYLLTR